MTALTAAVVSFGAKSPPAANGATAAARVHSPIIQPTNVNGDEVVSSSRWMAAVASGPTPNATRA